MTTVGRVAAFDVDGTLTTTDCVVPFMRRVVGTPQLVGRLAMHPISMITDLGRRDRDALKASAAMATFGGVPVDSIEAEAHEFAREVCGRRLRHDVVTTLRHHVDIGDTVVLVSASFEVYLRPMAELLGAHAVLATRLEVGSNQTYTGRLLGANCRGPEKVVRLHRWLAEQGADRSAVHVTAYGDSAGDRELLADADVAHWVGGGEMPVP